MLNKNYAGTTASIIRSTFPNITAPKQVDLVSMLDQVGKDYQTGLQVRADNKLTDELIAQNPEDEARIRQMGGRAYADMLKSDAQRAEERQWHLEDLEAQRQFQRDLLRDKLNNEFALAKWKSQNVGYDPTAAERNVAAMVATGKFTPDQAWAIQFAGGNPSFDVSQLGQKGFEAYDKASGSNLAEQEKQHRDAQAEYDNLVESMDRVEELLPRAGVDSLVDRKTPTVLFDSDVRNARGELRNLLGGLRLDQLQYLKGAVSDTEQQFISDVVSGDFSKYTPEEIKGAMTSIKRKAGQAVKKYEPSLKDFNPANDPLSLR